MKKTVRQNIAFGLLFFILWVPFLGKFVVFPNLPGLKGYVPLPAKIAFNWDSYSTQKYQENREKHLKRELKSARFFIPFNNQYKYWLFGKLNAQSSFEGKDDYLFINSYYEEYVGTRFIGEEEIKKRVGNIKEFSDSLSQYGVRFLFVINPGKVRTMNEFLPESMKPDTLSTQTNYHYFKKEILAQGMPLLDNSLMFEHLCGKTPYPIYSKGGIHWSDYGSYIALDSTIAFMETVLDTQIMRPIRKDTVITNIPRKVDNDIGDAFNLLFNQEKYEQEQLAYFNLRTDTMGSQYRPNVLVISDSYYWNWYGNKVQKKLFGDLSEFWYYNQTIWPKRAEKNVIEIKDMKGRLQEKDLVIFMITEGNLSFCSFSLDQRVLNKLKENAELRMQN